MSISLLNAQEIITNLCIEITSSIEKLNGKFTINNINWTRIENPQLLEKSSIGMFIVPPSKKLQFDVAFVIADLAGNDITTGDYSAVKVIKDIPQFIPGLKEGFMTLVVNNSEIPKDEYYSTSGQISLTKISDIVVEGQIDIILQSTKYGKQINVAGNFTIKL